MATITSDVTFGNTRAITATHEGDTVTFTGRVPVLEIEHAHVSLLYGESGLCDVASPRRFGDEFGPKWVLAFLS